MVKRNAGVLLNVSMLPNEFGIGGFGEELIEFAKWLKYVGFTKWQTLPLTAIGLGDSPYSGHSAFAGNYLYIDPKLMCANGYITCEEASCAISGGSVYTVDYAAVTDAKRRLIKLAMPKLTDSGAVKNYATKMSYWLDDYACYMAIKSVYGGAPWYEWESGLKERDEDTVANFVAQHQEQYDYYVAEQYLFDEQWQQRKEEINAIGVEIIGDMPIYVSYDSADVWAHRDIFQLDGDSVPIDIAGVPPDYFSTKGQLWGNPLYDYVAMADNNYDWFIQRGKRMAALYNTVRIDHFRAFDRYWAVPYGSADAINGEWRTANGYELLSEIIKACPNLNIIAEDLGTIDDGVRVLRDRLGLAGMSVMQFGFDDPQSTNSPHNFLRNSVAYTGTHDNSTLFGWLYDMGAEQRRNVYAYCGAPGGLEGGAQSKQIYSVIRTLLTSAADTAIVPFQDLRGWGNDTRLNVPGVAEGNWRVRVTTEDINTVDSQKYRELISITGRM